MLKEAFNIRSIADLYEKQTKTVKFIRKSNKANRLLRDSQSELHDADPNPFDAFHRSLGWEKVLPPPSAH